MITSTIASLDVGQQLLPEPPPGMFLVIDMMSGGPHFFMPKPPVAPDFDFQV